LRKHDDKNGLNEEIHAIFEQFGEDDRGDDVSSRWLQKAPESAYANLARGSYLVGRAWRMRGKQSAAQTPDSNFENMHALLDRAIPLLQKAVALNPRLVPADIELMSAGMLGGRADVAEAAFAAAQKQSPACLVLVQQRMQSLLPRWGGSLEQEEAYKSELMPYLDRHPAIAIYFSMSIHDQATALFYNYGTSTHDDFYKTGSATLLDHAVDIGSYDEALHDAGDVALNRADAPADDWRGFALLLQEARFKYGNVWADKTISWQLLHDEPEWALHYLVRAEQIEPTDPELQYMLGAANYNAHRYDEAQRHYDMAILDPGQRQAALRESSSMWLQNAALSPRQQAAKATPYVDRLLSEYPNDGRGWVYHFNCLGKLGEIVSTEQIRKFLLVADRTDPVQARAISTSESILGRKRDK
jgi:tetratricopeptide (TPR) repeat protein